MRAERIAWIVGGVGLVLCVLGAILDPDSFAFAWLAATMVWLRWPLGCLSLLLVHALTGGRWGFSVRPWLALGIGLFPLLLPAPHLYPWLRPGIPNSCGLDRAARRSVMAALDDSPRPPRIRGSVSCTRPHIVPCCPAPG